MMSVRRPMGMQVWFLDRDLTRSAEYLTNDALDKSIDGAVAALVCARFYFMGIRNKKAYDYYFSRDRRQETMSGKFPSWPFRNPPSFKKYSQRVSKWTRRCGEHMEYMEDYLDRMLTEYEYRRRRRHRLAKFLDWLRDGAPELRVPKAGIAEVTLPWKCTRLKFRRKDIIEGFRLQYMDVYCWEDPMKEFLDTGRDVPEFVVSRYNLDTASMIT